MKVLIVNTSDISGGAARAAYRLHSSLLSTGIDSKMLVQIKKSDDYTVIPIYGNNKIGKAFSLSRPTLDQIPVKFYKNKIKTLFSPAWLPFSKAVEKINEINPDIVHLHWITGGMIKIEDLAKINKPIVWTLHDNWAFTGGCHRKWECEKYINSCGACPILNSNKEVDLSRRIWYRKKKTYEKIKMIIVSPSNLLAECSKRSSLLKHKMHYVIPNPINTNIFKPINKEIARNIWNLPKNKKIIAFGAFSATSDINKGFKELINALNKISDKKNIELVVFGSSEPKNSPNFEFKTHYLGHLYDDISLVVLYNAVDVMVVPSLWENLSNTIMESLACATPVVAFDVGGNSDMIEHFHNGYLAKPFDIDDLKNGIEWVLNAPNYDELCKNAREKVLRDFNVSIIVKKYIEIYFQVIKNVSK
jgi:glycosyltransferase involved in cell wall biosynthesis